MEVLTAESWDVWVQSKERKGVLRWRRNVSYCFSSPTGPDHLLQRQICYKVSHWTEREDSFIYISLNLTALRMLYLTEMYILRHVSLQIYSTMICFQDIDSVRFELYVRVRLELQLVHQSEIVLQLSVSNLGVKFLWNPSRNVRGTYRKPALYAPHSLCALH
jgi:hypothetical protein